MDGLELYGSEYVNIRFQSALLEKIKKLEVKAQSLARSPLPRQEFAEKHALLVGRFMRDVQNILVFTSLEANDYVPWTTRLSQQDFAGLIWEFYESSSEADKIQKLARCLDGLERPVPYFSPAALRSITTLARFLDPADWGAMCWRTLACLGFPSMTELKQMRLRKTPSEMHHEFERLTVQDIVDRLARMRLLICEDLPEVSRVALALYCISLDLWPADAHFEYHATSENLPLDPCSPRTATV